VTRRGLLFSCVGYLQFCRERDESVVGEKMHARDQISSERLCFVLQHILSFKKAINAYTRSSKFNSVFRFLKSHVSCLITFPPFTPDFRPNSPSSLSGEQIAEIHRLSTRIISPLHLFSSYPLTSPSPIRAIQFLMHRHLSPQW
jgi:hypothetical protein